MNNHLSLDVVGLAWMVLVFGLGALEYILLYD